MSFVKYYCHGRSRVSFLASQYNNEKQTKLQKYVADWGIYFSQKCCWIVFFAPEILENVGKPEISGGGPQISKSLGGKQQKKQMLQYDRKLSQSIFKTKEKLFWLSEEIGHNIAQNNPLERQNPTQIEEYFPDSFLTVVI